MFPTLTHILTQGYYNSLGAMSSYGFLLSQAYKAESNIVAQPGACLTVCNAPAAIAVF